MTDRNFIRISFSFIIASWLIITTSVISPNVIRILNDNLTNWSISMQTYTIIYLVSTIISMMAVAFIILVWYDHVTKLKSNDHS